MLNIGIRPTVSNDGQVSREVYIFDFNRDLYGKNITINFIDRIRENVNSTTSKNYGSNYKKTGKKILKLLESE